MRQYEEMGAERDMLERIVALLLALAGLAERAALASGRKRCQALLALQHANAVALELIAGRCFNLAGQQWSPALVPTHYGTAPADATNLATALRALAFLVQTIAARIRSRSTWSLDQACLNDTLQPATYPLVELLPTKSISVQLCDTS